MVPQCNALDFPRRVMNENEAVSTMLFKIADYITVVLLHCYV